MTDIVEKLKEHAATSSYLTECRPRGMIHEVVAEIERLREALRGLLALRERTEADHESAYHAMFKSDGSNAWEAARAALGEDRA